MGDSPSLIANRWPIERQYFFTHADTIGRAVLITILEFRRNQRPPKEPVFSITARTRPFRNRSLGVVRFLTAMCLCAIGIRDQTYRLAPNRDIWAPYLPPVVCALHTRLFNGVTTAVHLMVIYCSAPDEENPLLIVSLVRSHSATFAIKNVSACDFH